MQSLFPTTQLNSIITGVIGNAVFWCIAIALEWLRRRSATRNPRYRWTVPALTVALWLAFNVAYAYLVRRYCYIALMTSTVLSGWILFQELKQFWRIGLVGADFEIKNGIDYIKALGLCSSSLDFLGIGASKLTDAKTPFEEAIRRCDRPGHPIRFLLSSPDNLDLQRIARKAGVDEKAYQKRVRGSLRMIADLRISRARNIEVRFYKEIPAFRLMFIDDDICLTSYYVLGKDAETHLPQLHIVNRRGSKDINSLYYGFRSYFENIWEESEVWDFGKYLNE